MDPMYDLNSWSKQRREEALREARRRSLRTLVNIAIEDPRHPDVVHCFTRYANPATQTSSMPGLTEASTPALASRPTQRS